MFLANLPGEAYLALALFIIMLIVVFFYMHRLTVIRTTVTIEEGHIGIKFKNGKFEKYLGIGSYTFNNEKEVIYIVSTQVEYMDYQNFLYTTADNKLIKLAITLKIQCQHPKLLVAANKTSFWDSDFLIREVLKREVNQITQKITFTDLINNYSLLDAPLFEILKNYFPSQTGYTLLDVQSIARTHVDEN